jgi:hypothetical protein
MVPISYQVVGEEDYAFGVQIKATGAYVVNSGTYTSRPPRSGCLTTEQEDELLSAIEALGIPEPHPMPEGGTAFQAKLVIGEPGQEISYPFWEGALQQDEKLRELVGILERL